MDGTFDVDAVVERILFRNAENGYTVAKITGQIDHEEDEEFTCVGYIPEISLGENLLITGKWVDNPKYGPQISIIYAEKNVKTTADSMEKYLASGIISGVGKAMAKRIVAAFGENTFVIIEETPERLTEINGITPAKAANIAEVFHEKRDQRKTMLILQEYGVSPTFAMKIYNKYKAATLAIIKNNPYKLADDIDGIGFKKADNIAQTIGIGFDSPFRVAAGIVHSLEVGFGSGHVFLPQKMLINEAAKILQLAPQIIENTLKQMQIDQTIYCEKFPEDDDTAVFLNYFYYTEINVARRLHDLAEVVPQSEKQAIRTMAEESAKTFETETDLQLSKDQFDAIIEANLNGVLIITGGPGTGKTTTIKTMIHLLSKRGLKIELAAPTGRAAKRIAETTNHEAKTIHRLLEPMFSLDSRQTFQRDEDNPLETDVLIVDEASMIDIFLMNSLLKALTPGTRLIMVGDVDQLPPVGPGNVLKDIIASGCIKVVRLTEIFRQMQDSAIIMNAHKINSGKYPALNERNNDFFFIKRTDQQNVIAEILDLVSERLPKYISGNSMDIQVLTPMRKSNLGAFRINQFLQNHLNPPAAHKREMEYRQVIFRENDKVMHIKNNYELAWEIKNADNTLHEEGSGVFNGDTGKITQITNSSLTVLFDDNRQVVYDITQISELELAYAITVHKSQGSEYAAVVIPIHSGPDMLFNRNLLYTAVTRAKKLCVIVGIPETLHKMVDNNQEVLRYTRLSHRIRAVGG
ncbi:MAG: ATP-dependent RecD-like DNA helicase [Defluviitaleaceae bacterium]|nr:ATP-dependent RecD-like DNA helicase [Defluviitaleaceae bacterium]